MTIEPKISKYIDDKIEHAIERERKIFNDDVQKFNRSLIDESKRHMEALKEFFHDEVIGLSELIQDRPTREEVRGIAREEINEALQPVNAKLDFLNDERREMMEAIAEIKA